LEVESRMKRSRLTAAGLVAVSAVLLAVSPLLLRGGMSTLYILDLPARYGFAAWIPGFSLPLAPYIAGASLGSKAKQ
jgi:hypothetical protein